MTDISKLTIIKKYIRIKVVNNNQYLCEEIQSLEVDESSYFYMHTKQIYFMGSNLSQLTSGILHVPV